MGGLAAEWFLAHLAAPEVSPAATIPVFDQALEGAPARVGWG